MSLCCLGLEKVSEYFSRVMNYLGSMVGWNKPEEADVLINFYDDEGEDEQVIYQRPPPEENEEQVIYQRPLTPIPKTGLLIDFDKHTTILKPIQEDHVAIDIPEEPEWDYNSLDLTLTGQKLKSD